MPKILVADDNQEMLDTLERIFSFYKFEVAKAENGREAVELARSVHPDLILLDGMMPVMDGFEACKILKSESSTKHIPIVFLTANYIQEEDKITGFELGADDYLLKPFNSKELVARTNALLKRTEMMYQLKSENEELLQKNRQIEEKLTVLIKRTDQTDKEAFIDPLTGLYKFSFFEKRLREEFQRAIRYGTPLSLVVIKLNNLEELLKKLGGQLGNYLLIKLTNYLLTKTRTSDILARGQEGGFYVLLPQTDRLGCAREAGRLRKALDNAEYIDKSFIETVKISKREMDNFRKINIGFGMSSYPDPGLEMADEKVMLSLAGRSLIETDAQRETIIN